MSWIKIRGTELSVKKITQVVVRKSYLYFRYPYVMELQYHEPWQETSWIYNPAIKVPIPDTIYHDYEYYKYKYQNQAQAYQDLDKLINSGVKRMLFIDKIGRNDF